LLKIKKGAVAKQPSKKKKASCKRLAFLLYKQYKLTNRIVAHTPKGNRIVAHTPKGNRIVAHTPKGNRIVAHTPKGNRIVAHTPKGNRIVAHTPKGNRIARLLWPYVLWNEVDLMAIYVYNLNLI